jgi:benzoate-CoA ligase
MSIEKVAAPGEVFNYAQHLLELNRQRADKTAYIDDRGKLSYGELESAARSLGSALLAAGIHREERVLLLMHDCNDWPISFLGAIYAGIVPVAVNTLLTADDYLYMLQHSRARCAGVGGIAADVAGSDGQRLARCVDSAGVRCRRRRAKPRRAAAAELSATAAAVTASRHHPP